MSCRTTPASPATRLPRDQFPRPECWRECLPLVCARSRQSKIPATARCETPGQRTAENTHRSAPTAPSALIKLVYTYCILLVHSQSEFCEGGGATGSESHDSTK